jgi:hypothetical protein
MGGASQPDKTFYYVAAEQELARGEDANDIGAGPAALINNALRATGPLPGLHLQTGFIPTTEEETELSGRIDRTLTAEQKVMLRYAFTNTRNVNDAFNTDELSDGTARGSSFTADNSLNGTLSSTLGPKTFNAFNIEVAQRRVAERTVSQTGPGVLITTLDDLSETSLARLSSDGFNPCAVVETSAGNFKAWLKHPRMFSEATRNLCRADIGRAV